MKDTWERLKEKKRIVVKIGSSSLQHMETGELDYTKLDVLVRELCDLRNQGKDVVLVTSGAIAVGKKAVAGKEGKEDNPIAVKQAYAAVGQARLMMTYQKIFAEYNQVAAQILMTKNTIVDNLNRFNAQNTFAELFKLGVIPIVNENDTVATYEIEIGDNDTLSAIVASLVKADLLLLLSDIDGLYTDDPRKNPEAEHIDVVQKLTDELMEMGKASTGSDCGTGGMNTKLQAAKIAGSMGVDMVIASSKDIKDIHRILNGKNIGTLFLSSVDDSFDLPLYVQQMHGH
ncbi:MAG: glutamate 5-kinase [Lachnospiraceae bacterium]|nr:glutamate 5-kinase [Lachnospiraceae bacterium]